MNIMDTKNKHHKMKKSKKAHTESKMTKHSDKQSIHRSKEKLKGKREVPEEETKDIQHQKKHKEEPKSKEASITKMKLNSSKQNIQSKSSTLRISVGCYNGSLWIYEASVDELNKDTWRFQVHSVSEVSFKLIIELFKKFSSRCTKFGCRRI